MMGTFPNMVLGDRLLQLVALQAPLKSDSPHLWVYYTSGHSQTAEIILSWINLDVH